MLRRTYRWISLMLLVPILFGLLPSGTLGARSAGAAPPMVPSSGLGSPPAPEPVRLQATPQPDLQLPSLSLQTAITPDHAAVGDDLTVTLTATNQAPDPAQNLIISVPVPAGTTT